MLISSGGHLEPLFVTVHQADYAGIISILEQLHLQWCVIFEFYRVSFSDHFTTLLISLPAEFFKLKLIEFVII